MPIASTGFAVMSCYDGILNSYLFYYLMSPAFDAYANNTDNAKGVAYPAINDERLYKALIPIPPVAEQYRIVEIIETLTNPICEYGNKEVALRSLNNNFPELLKKSILQQAIQGKLVAQDPNDEPASVLLERIRAEKEQLIMAGKIKRDKHESIIFRRDNSHYEKRGSEEVCIDDEIPYEIPSGWSWSRLGTCLDVRDGTHDTPRYVPEGVPLVTSKNLSNGRIDFSTAKLISREDSQAINQRSKVDSGDIMYDGQIADMLHNVMYKGDLLLQKSYKDENRQTCRNEGQVQSWYVHDDHEAIVSSEQWERVQQVLAARSARIAEAKERRKAASAHHEHVGRYPLTGLLFCPHCGAVLHHKWCNSGRDEYWVCSTNIKKRASSCKGIFLPSSVADSWNIKAPVVVQRFKDDNGMVQFTAYPKDEYEAMKGE